MSWPTFLLLPFASATVICVVINFQVNRQLWRLQPIDFELNPFLRWFMRKFGVDKGMLTFCAVTLFVAVALLIQLWFTVPPAIFIDMILLVNATLSPLSIGVLINDYKVLSAIKNGDIVTFKVP